jgi:hypothetical protein
MAIATFSGSSTVGTPQVSGTSEGGSKTIITIVVVGLLGYLVYKYLIKPEMDKNKLKNENG